MKKDMYRNMHIKLNQAKCNEDESRYNFVKQLYECICVIDFEKVGD